MLDLVQKGVDCYLGELLGSASFVGGVVGYGGSGGCLGLKGKVVPRRQGGLITLVVV